MGKNVLIAGASGMVGGLILENCLKDEQVINVISLVRKASNLKHDKLKEIVVSDFLNYDTFDSVLNSVDIVYYCIGVYTGVVEDEKFVEVTVDYPVALANKLKEISPDTRFCLLSGQGADRTEKSKLLFAKNKGIAENKITSLLNDFYAIRPSYIYPVIKRNEPNMAYRIFRMIYPLVKLISKNYSITSVQLANAMFLVGRDGAEKHILENIDLLEIVDNK